MQEIKTAGKKAGNKNSKMSIDLCKKIQSCKNGWTTQPFTQCQKTKNTGGFCDEFLKGQ